MRATFIHGIRDVRLGEVEPPRPREGMATIRVAGCGICGSDLHYYLEGGIGAAQVRDPFVPGHEFAGWVVDDHPALGLSRGQLVAVDPAHACGRCEWCHRGHVNLCPHVEFLGAPPLHGGMAERLAVRPEQLVPVPSGFSVRKAVMLEPLGVAIHAMDLARPHLQETVAVLGCGPIALCLVQLARLAGVERVFAIDPVAYRAEAARRLGAHDAAPTFAAIAEWTGGRGVDLVIEATNSPEGFHHAAEAARIGGRILLAGIPEGDRYSLPAALCRRKGLKIKFSRRMGHVYPRAIRLVAEGAVDVESIVTHRFDLSEAEKGFRLQADCQDGALKSIIVPDEGDTPF
ncbi:alcohol dehydrogenase catalytic domain-containing protein [Sorangium sp. So ce302]|uniref:zinc-dependent alcohol dehydrogenase n=1 Tax=Sorangium sp. So ce302 TaxID=3133297 RepID=UPI003F5DA2A0